MPVTTCEKQNEKKGGKREAPAAVWEITRDTSLKVNSINDFNLVHQAG